MHILGRLFDVEERRIEVERRPRSEMLVLGTVRFDQRSGFTVGAIVTGVLADFAGARSAIWLVAALTLLSGIVVERRMDETHQKARSG